MIDQEQPEQEAEALPSVCEKDRRQSIPAGDSCYAEHLARYFRA